MIKTLLSCRTYPPRYILLELAVTYTNLGIILINLGLWDLFETWYKTWEDTHALKLWPRAERFLVISRSVLAIRLSYLVRTRQWQRAIALWEKAQQDLYKVVLESEETVSFRLNRACSVFFLLLVSPGKYREAIRWRLAVEAWIEREKYREIGYMWWNFLRWYESFRSQDRRWMRHWYRKVYQVWRAYFSVQERWRLVLRLMRAISDGEGKSQRRVMKAIYQRWEQMPAEKLRWEYDSLIFPMSLFLQSVGERKAIESYPPISNTSSYFEDKVQEVEEIIRLFSERLGHLSALR